MKNAAPNLSLRRSLTALSTYALSTYALSTCALSICALSFAALSLSVAPSPAAAQRQYRVRSGQSWARIARRHHLSVWDLALANRRRPSSPLRAGQTLTLPPQGVTFVRPGQSLARVARSHDTTIAELTRLNHLRRGRTLRVGQRLVLPGFQPPEERAARDRDWGTPESRGQSSGHATIVRRSEHISLQLLDSESRVTADGLRGVANLMRRHDEDEAQIPHPRLIRLLAAISDHFGGREITLVSGRRSARRFTRQSSRHVSNQATDIRVAGVPRRVLWDYCRSLSSTGCGYYPRSTFVHVDVREQATQWVDWSRPGQRPRYGDLRRAWPRQRRARSARARRRQARQRRQRSRVGRTITRPDEVPTETLLTAEAATLVPAPAAEPDVSGDSDESEETEGWGEGGENAPELAEERPEA